MSKLFYTIYWGVKLTAMKFVVFRGIQSTFCWRYAFLIRSFPADVSSSNSTFWGSIAVFSRVFITQNDIKYTNIRSKQGSRANLLATADFCPC